MKLFKNKVGRPSNEILKKRKIIKISMFLFIVLIASVLTFTLSKINNKKLKGAASAALELVDYKILEEDYEILNFKKIGDNYYAFFSSNSKYYLSKLNEDGTLSDTKLEIVLADGDSISLYKDIYVTEDNKIIAVGNYFIYKYSVNDNSVTKEFQSEKALESSIAFNMMIYAINSNYFNNNVVIWRKDSNKYLIRTYSLDNNTLSNVIEYNLDATDSQTSEIKLEQVIINDDGNYELFLLYKGSGQQLNKIKIVTINSSGSILNNKDITKSELDLPDDIQDCEFIMVEKDEFKFVMTGLYNNEAKNIIKYISIDGNNIIKKDVEINASDFLDEEYDESGTMIMNTFKSGDDYIFIVEAATETQDYETSKIALGTMKLDESGNFVVTSKNDLAELNEEYNNVYIDDIFYSQGKLLVQFFKESEEEDINGYMILNYVYKYNLNIEANANGTVTLIDNDTSFKNGDSVSFIVTPNEGYEVKSIKVLDEDDNDITESVNLTNNTFNMPNKNVKLQVEFEAISTSASTSLNNISTKTTINKFSTNPKTYDDVIKYLIIGVISIVIVGLSLVVVIKNRKK